MKNMELKAGIVEQGRSLLEEHGWVQDVYEDYDGARCISRALSEARKEVAGVHGYSVSSPFMSAIVVSIFEDIKAKIGSVDPTMWNDKPGRTYYEVDELLGSLSKDYRSEVAE